MSRIALSIFVLALPLLVAGCQQLHVYWGDVHGHTAVSDGEGTPEEYFRHARDKADLDFAIVTDHDFGNSPPWRMPLATWKRTQELADRFTVRSVFVAIAGYEWTSQPKYWKEWQGEAFSERLFDGPTRFYGHRVVYFPCRVPDIFSAKEEAYRNPALLAVPVRRAGGLIHIAHPGTGDDSRDQWKFALQNPDVIVNTEIGPDLMIWKGDVYRPMTEQAVHTYLNEGGKVGIVGGTDTHQGKPAARTAVLARALSREAIFDGLRRHHCYAVSHARIVLDFRINGALMGDEIVTREQPRLSVRVQGTAGIEEVRVLRDGVSLRTYHPAADRFQISFTDESFLQKAWYQVKVTQTDKDEAGNPSRAWSSPIWVARGTAQLLPQTRVGLGP